MNYECDCQSSLFGASPVVMPRESGHPVRGCGDIEADGYWIVRFRGR
jgi:hypothetical protein